MATEFEKELIKLYEKLKDSPEKGFVERIPATGLPGDDDFVDVSFEPTQDEWTSAREAEQEQGSLSKQDYIISLYKEYGLGPWWRTVYTDDPGVSPPRWYHETKTHLSKDGKYYIVPIVYERMTNNPALQQFLVNGKIQIYGANGVLKNTAFIESAKAWALEKLAADLSKALSMQNRIDGKNVAFLPVDSKSTLTKNQSVAQAWYVEHRPEEFQNLFLKMMFDRSWVDSLSPRAGPCADLSDVKHTVMLFVKTLEKDLADLQDILYRFEARILETTVSVDFDAACAAGKVSNISELLNRLLKLNDKPVLSRSSPAALQIAFDNEYNIQYIAYSEVPDCLCDEENMSAYILKKGVEDLKSTPPFDSSTINALLYYLPDIVRKYSPYLTGAKSKYLFAAQESWVQFIKSYVFPVPEVAFDTSGTSEQLFMEKMAAFGKLSNKVASLMKKGSFLQDPTLLLGPEQRALLLGLTNGQQSYAGDDVMMNSVKSPIFSMQTLYDRLLNRIPVTALIKIAATAIVKCTGDNALKKKLCRKIFKAMPKVDIETKLIPCLISAGEITAANKLRTTIGGRQQFAYGAAKERWPDKFTKSPAQAIKSEAEMAKVNNLYCADPAFQKMLGRPIDDFSEEQLLWLEKHGNDAICECIINIYGPVQQLIDFVEDLKDDTGDIVDAIAGQNKAQQIESTTTYSFKKTFAPFKAFLWDEQGDFNPAKQIFDIYFKILLAAVVVVLNHVKSEYIGGLLRDACNVTANPFSKKSITNMVMNSPLYSDKSYQQIKNTVKKAASMAGLAGEIGDIMEALDKLGEQFTPSEFKRLFTTPCSDISINTDLIQKVTQTFYAYNITQQGATTNDGGTATDAALANGVVPPLCPAPKTPAPSYGSVQTLLFTIGTWVNPTLFDDEIDALDKVGDQIANLCDPESRAILAIDPEAIPRIAEEDKEALTEDIIDMLPLLDPSKIENMMPPIFCGPCKPSQVGQQPLMPNQSHPSELVMLERANSDLFNMINEKFNNNLEGYKPIILEVGDNQLNLTDALRDAAGGSVNPKIDTSILGVTLPFGFFTRDVHKALKQQMSLAMAQHDKSKGEIKRVAHALINEIEEATALINMKSTDIDEFILFEYKVPDAEILITMMINYSESPAHYHPLTGAASAVAPTNPGGWITVDLQQIKIIAIDKATNIIKFQWPDPSSPNATLSDPINISDESLINALTNTLATEVLESFTFSALSDSQVQTFKNQFPIITNLIFENVLRQGTTNDLFKAPVFNKIPLTDAEVYATCIEGIGETPLLNVEKLSEDVDKARQALECVVSAFANPGAEQIANLYGLYKLLMKVCIIEEYLKNIFIFGFLRVSDITRSGGYLQLIQDNIINSITALAGQSGYDKLLDYSAKIINGRLQLGEDFSTEGGIEKILTPIESFKILIAEATEEIDDILDARIQGIVDPEWTKKFYAWGEVGTEEADIAILGRILEYAINSPPEYWSPDLYPYKAPGDAALEKLKAMQYIGDPQNIWPRSNDGKGWPARRGPGELEYWEGGMFFQPYIKIESKIESEADFWSKFLAAEALTKSSWDKYDSLEHAGVKSTIDSVIAKLRDHIDDYLVGLEGGPAPDDTASDVVEAFFNLVFKPEKDAGGHKLPFMRVVSSFWSPEQDGHAIPQVNSVYPLGDPYYYWHTDTTLSFLTGLAGEDAIDGGTPSTMWHWANRGVISTHRADRLFAWNESETLRLQTKLAFIPNPNDYPDTPAYAPLKADWKSQRTDIYNEIANLPGISTKNHSTGPAVDGAKLYESTPALFGIVKEINYHFPRDPSSPEVPLPQATATEQFLNKLESIEWETADPSVANPAQMKYHPEYSKAFWNRIRNIIFESPYSTWFDFKFGMRLNLLTPMESAAPNFFSQIHTDAYGDYARYNDEKTFIWEREGIRYFCFPIEQIEHDAIDFAPVGKYFNSMATKLTSEGETNLGFKSIVSNGESQPTLWATARAIDNGFFTGSDKILNALKKEAAIKAVAAEEGSSKAKLLTNIVPIKEILTTSALFYRYYMEEAYPSLNTLFNPTKNTVVRIIAAMTAASEGDYAYLDPLLDLPPGASSNMQSPSDAEVARKFMLLFVQMAANMFDPTWQTPWFMPGPLTPIGIVAKALLTDWSDDEDSDSGAKSLTVPDERICPPYISITEAEPSLIDEPMSDIFAKDWATGTHTGIVIKAAANGKYVRALKFTGVSETGEQTESFVLFAHEADASSLALDSIFTRYNLGNNEFGLLAAENMKYVVAEDEGKQPLEVDRDKLDLWETFIREDLGDGKFAFKAKVNDKYVTAEDGGAEPLIANRDVLGPWETFSEHAVEITDGVITLL